MYRPLLVTLSYLVLATSAGAQDSLAFHRPLPSAFEPKLPWITRHDVMGAGVALGGVALLSMADEPVAQATQRPLLQQNSGLHNSANFIQSAGDPGALIVSATLYVAGRMTHHPGLADASKHAVMSIVLSAGITQSLKLSAGRARPNLTSGQNAYAFHPFHGAKTDYNSFPSGHTTAAFATAGAFTAELGRTHPKANRIVRPLLFGVATLVGGARMYNNRHWLSDVATGALIGGFTARRVVHHAHDEQ